MSRTKWMGVSAIVLGAIWLSASFFSKPSYVNYPPTKGQTWVALGDSLTAGVGAGPGQDYPSQLGKRLGQGIINRGVPGDTTADALERIWQVEELDPRVVLLCLGGNDSLRQTPMDQTLLNLSAIIDRLQSKGAFIILIGIRSASVFDQFEKPLESLAKRKGALYIPNFLKGVLGNRKLMADQIHPNAEGYSRIADRLEKILRPHLPQLMGSSTTTGSTTLSK